MKKYLLILTMFVINMTAFAKSDMKTMVFTTNPVMHCESCEKKIKGNLRFIKGVRNIETNIEKQTVTIEFNPSKVKVEDIEAGFKKIGYSVKTLSKAKPIK